MPLLIKIGLAHAQFETIHPFLDGNGRVGRLLITITFLLCEGGVLHKPVLYLSHYFRRHRQAYYDLLQSIRDRGQWEASLIFFLRGVAEVSVQTTETARPILTLREGHRNLITDNLGYSTGNGHRVLEHLYERPIISTARSTVVSAGARGCHSSSLVTDDDGASVRRDPTEMLQTRQD